MAKKLSKFMAVILGFVMCFALFAVAGCGDRDDEEKIYFDFSQISLGSWFYDNQILVTFKNKESLKFKDYTPEDFSEVDCIEVHMDKAFYEVGYYKGDEAVKAAIESGELDKNLYHRTCCLTLAEHDKQGVLDGMKELEKRRDILKVYPGYYDTLDIFSNDSNNYNQWAISKIELDKTWNITTGSNTVKVGIIDTGIDANHPDLANRVDRTLSESFYNETWDPLQDVVGHGTHVAGIIGAEGNNSIGITGVCWNVSLVSLRVENESGHLYVPTVTRAIKYAKDNNIMVINYSGGGYVWDNDAKDREEEIKNYPGLFVTSSGNDYKDTDMNLHYPSSHTYDNIISVGASTRYDWIASFSNYGATSVDVFAPGDGIWSTIPGTYDAWGGTSMAAPFVTGVAALIKSKYPDMSATEIKARILDNVDKISAFDGRCVTSGRLNAYRAVHGGDGHTYTYSYLKTDNDNHDSYCVCGASITEKHAWQYYKKPALKPGKEIIEEYIEEEGTSAIKPGTEMIQCKQCKFVRILGSGELIPLPWEPGRVKPGEEAA